MYRKNSAELSEEYDFDENIIIDNPKVKKVSKKSLSKVLDEDFFIPEHKQYEVVNILNFNVKQLKQICKHYKQRLTGNKNEIKKRIYLYLKHSHYIKKIQNFFIKKLYDKYRNSKGPIRRLNDLNKCINQTDFITMEPLEKIPYWNLFSFEQNSNIYGFNIKSIYTYHMMNSRDNKDIINPYDRTVITKETISKMKAFLRISKLLNLPIDIVNKDEGERLTLEQIVRNKTISVFQKMDSLGHITNPIWFTNLDIRRLLRYIRELHDIWEYRAQLSLEVKKSIHYPLGNPFTVLQSFQLTQNSNINNLRKTVLHIIDELITKGVDHEHRCLGCFYVLGAFTLVNHEAAIALPWLYESVHYFNN